MVGEPVTELMRFLVLALLDDFVLKLIYPTAARAHDVVVVIPPLQLEHRMAALEMVPVHQPRRLKLGQHAIHRGQPDLLAVFHQHPVNVFGRQVARGTALQHLDDLEARQGNFETDVAEFLGFHGSVREDFLYYCTPLFSSTSMRVILFALFCFALSGCELIYKLDTRQGNVIEQKQLDKLALGMTREQVKFVLGTPIAASPFREDRWDYAGYYKSHRGKVFQRTVTLYFEGEKLARMEGERPTAAVDTIEKPNIKELEKQEKKDQLEVERAEEAEKTDSGIVITPKPETP